MQLVPIKGGNWGPIREAQAAALALLATAMVVITDGDADIHPRKKQLPGTRLALAARAVASGEKVEYSGPTFASQKIDGERVTLSFKHVGGGLAVRGEKLIGFPVVDADGKTHAAEAAIDGETVVVTPKGVKPAEGTLINKEGLPASPFRSVKPEKKCFSAESRPVRRSALALTRIRGHPVTSRRWRPSHAPPLPRARVPGPGRGRFTGPGGEGQ